MDIQHLKSQLVFLNQLGVTVNTEERLKLEIILFKLLESHSFDQLLFWGKIEGTPFKKAPKKTTISPSAFIFQDIMNSLQRLFSIDFKDFQPLPPIDLDYKDKVEDFKTPFTGLPETVLVKVDTPEQPIDPEPLDSDDEVPKPPPVSFTELGRLAYVVQAIEVDCHTVPKGAFKLNQSHELNYNTSFPGLTIQEAHDLNNYLHFRNAQNTKYKNYLLRQDVIFQYDFLEPLSEDQPKGCWSVQSNSQRNQITLRSLLWMGYVAYHQADSRIFGGLYIGNGLKNADLPFQFA